MLILFGFISQVQAQCSGSGECFDFKLVSAAAVNASTTRLTFSVRVNCDKDLSNVAFELPAGVRASAPKGQKYTYTIENTTNNPFYSVKFEGKAIKAYKNGAEDVFSYELPSSAFSKMSRIRIQAKAGQNVGTYSLNPQNCSSTSNSNGGGNGNGGNGNGNGGNGNGNGGNGNGNNGNGGNGNGGNGNGGNGNGNGGNGNSDCSDSQPRPIEGPAKPCPGEVVEYSIGNNYTSYDWDVPRAQAGNSPTGWEIVSGQGTNKVKVRVGMKNGTMKVTVNHSKCGTKVATLPVKPGNDIAVNIEGNTQYCSGDVLAFKASVSKANGNGNSKNSTYDFAWSVPSGWTIVSGQKSNTLVVKAGTASGEVSVMVASSGKKNKSLCEAGEATVTVTPKENCSPCTKPDLEVEAPGEVCASGEKIYKFAVEKRDPAGKVKYQFFLPEEFQVVSQGYGYVNVTVNNAKPDSTLFVTVVAVNGNNCGAEAVCLPVEVEDCPTGPCTKPTVALVAPDSVCNLSDEPATIRVAQVRAGVTYSFDVPEGFIILDEGVGFVTVVAVLEEAQLEQNYTFRVIATNDCGSTALEEEIYVNDCGNGNPLPVTLTRFEGVSRNGAVELAWSTASEINNDRFEIERSANGKDFKKVGEVKGNGNSSALIDYAYTDRTAASGTLYYRLRQVDFDNAFEYSKVIAVSHNAGSASQAAINVFPNPVTSGVVGIRFAEQVQGAATIRLSDLSGKVLHSQDWSSVDSQVDMNLTGLNLRAGIYMLSVTANGRSTTQRIVVR
ncbi:T9SS C-terminal target domain-containing protein [Rufibacter latericius]|uniref:T9SS C-terminal target domain-containing protein n=1 Tax=Rufibacter latericius TaxID=2487040 RepID=A0A3M9MUW9_9BACT|nr:T9SS C-terminal target domain-containing protein [Rufibacter latericius]